MRCFACLSPYGHRRRASFANGTVMSPESPPEFVSSGKFGRAKSNSDLNGLEKPPPASNEKAISFTLLELAAATQNFRDHNLIGEGGFGKVYKGRIDNGQVIAAKRLCSDAHQGNQEFIVEVLMLSLLHHHNLVNLIGYCAEGDHRVLVYEYMPKGSLADHLFDGRRKLDWKTRMKIAVGAAQGIEYLHCQAKPPVIYRDLKSANILLDNDYNPKLSDFGMAKLAPSGDATHVSTRVMGTYGYCAPDYAMSGKLTLKSDIFSFGVVLLELITGRMAYDPRRPQGEQSLVVWTRPYLRDRRRCVEMIDPELQGKFPVRTARHLISVASMMLREEPNLRPPITEIVEALKYLEFQSQSHPDSLLPQPLMPNSPSSLPHRRINTNG